MDKDTITTETNRVLIANAEAVARAALAKVTEIAAALAHTQQTAFGANGLTATLALQGASFTPTAGGSGRVLAIVTAALFNLGAGADKIAISITRDASAIAGSTAGEIGLATDGAGGFDGMGTLVWLDTVTPGTAHQWGFTATGTHTVGNGAASCSLLLIELP